VVPPGSLDKVYLIGAPKAVWLPSGSSSVLQGKFDGALRLYARPSAGRRISLSHAYDFRVVFDYFFPRSLRSGPNQPGEQPFGAVDVPQNAFQFWQSVYVPRLLLR
jgi:hypothetical protein